MLNQEQFILPERFIVRDPQGNQYAIEGVLGKGAFGAVDLVRERSDRRGLFALKEVINPDKGDRERSAFEGEVLKQLKHKALPCVLHVFENDRLKRVYAHGLYQWTESGGPALGAAKQMFPPAPGPGLNSSHRRCVVVFAHADPPLSYTETSNLRITSPPY